MNIADIRISRDVNGLPGQHLKQLTDEVERINVGTVSARPDTFAIYIEEKTTGELIAYAIVGIDDGGMLTIYAGRALVAGIGEIAFKGLFGAARIMGKPLRVHSNRPRMYARMMGATKFDKIFDADGVPQGVFYG